MLDAGFVECDVCAPAFPEVGDVFLGGRARGDGEIGRISEGWRVEFGFGDRSNLCCRCGRCRVFGGGAGFR
jgi:hypothetical protein